MNKAIFGVAGYPPNFYKSLFKKERLNIFTWIKSIGLDAMELQCTYGYRTTDDNKKRIKELSKENEIQVSVHGPYYINLGSKNNETAIRSKEEIIKSFKYAQDVGASRIVFHLGGGYGKTEDERKLAISNIIETLINLKRDVDYESIKLYPEIAGKANSLGSLEEIIEVCKYVDYTRPCIDFAHLHARTHGRIDSLKQAENTLRIIEKELGRDILNEAHFHVYPIAYTDKGEKVHKKYTDLDELGFPYGPNPDDVIKAFLKRGLSPYVICEAHESQDEGAILLKNKFFALKR